MPQQMQTRLSRRDKHEKQAMSPLPTDHDRNGTPSPRRLLPNIKPRSSASPGTFDNTQLTSRIEAVLTTDSSLVNTISEAVTKSILSSSELINGIVSAICTNERFIKAITDKLHEQVTQDVNDSVTHDISVVSAKHTELSKSYANLEKKFKKLDDKLDDQEQYSRRNCILIHGIKETEDENTTMEALNIFNNSMKLNPIMHATYIDRSHRLGPRRMATDQPAANGQKQKPRPRPIIVKFISSNARVAVLKNKKKLKGSGILVTESLTVKRQQLLREAKSLESVEATWTIDGRIHCQLKNKKHVVITTKDDLNHIDHIDGSE